MTIPSARNISIQSPRSSRKIWDLLTQPANTLKNDVQEKARLLSSVLVIFFPLALIAIFAGPLTSRNANPPTPGVLFAIVLIFAAYILSRTRYYSVGAWITIVVPVIAVSLPILASGTMTSVVSLVYLTLSVIFAGLLLSSRETLIVGIVIAILTLLMPQIRTAETGVSQNISIFTYILVTTGITVMVGRIRENNLRQLEQSQLELKQSLAEEEKSRIQAEKSRERAERSEQVKAAFLASMSHELRTPLNAIINFTKFVANGDLGEVNEEQAETLNDAIGSAKHLLNLINDVLDMSKIESGTLNLFIEDDVNLKSILDNVVSTGKSLLAEKPVELKLNIDGELPLIRADRQRILQILLNIISNACKFTPTGSINIKAQQQSDEVLISVRDTGPGIPLEDQSMVFEAFKQTETGLRQGGGTGLGMPISKNLVEAHSGRLWLESEVNKGTTFHIALPIKSSKLTPIFSATEKVK